ncbi:Uncharacterised protein [Mycobacteroides abscessus subsp. abscessus]|nr:Uncharacterised protein [Mycobacteroides abscessus subsp. abscessus]SLI77938.1 Uncharacterised protein [Mycobacteroides abscessus subsp. bolletii]SHX79552.1 Uncharacterised protein [Mycobacteroides abscessus subsp. abscessus]SIG74284.1 Uncharacterised protein [Mycobacteroides abscessus subsp. abscessus]SKD16663.1 Uncharacterised protein [Mycobacteroides abscessus subsp. abscessus]
MPQMIHGDESWSERAAASGNVFGRSQIPKHCLKSTVNTNRTIPVPSRSKLSASRPLRFYRNQQLRPMSVRSARHSLSRQTLLQPKLKPPWPNSMLNSVASSAIFPEAINFVRSLMRKLMI